MAKFCTNCGNKINEGEKFCISCGKNLSENKKVEEKTNNQNTVNSSNLNSKSKTAAGLLGIFLGAFGVHNFYLGYTNKAIPQLILGTAGALLCGIGPIVSGIWGFVEGIMILTGSINQDAQGNDLTD